MSFEKYNSLKMINDLVLNSPVDIKLIINQKFKSELNLKWKVQVSVTAKNKTK